MAGMLGNLSSSMMLTAGTTRHLCSTPELTTKSNALLNIKPIDASKNVVKVAQMTRFSARKWAVHSTAQLETLPLSDDDKKSWEACRETLSPFSFSLEEEDKILGKAFGYLHSPYWSEERKKEVPKFEIVNEILDYLRSLSLSDDDICKVLKKFPEVLGCSLEHEIKNNVQLLEKDWGIEGKSLRNLLLRNPKVLGYNVDCKGDCIAQCTRCWARF